MIGPAFLRHWWEVSDDRRFDLLGRREHLPQRPLQRHGVTAHPSPGEEPTVATPLPVGKGNKMRVIVALDGYLELME